jgi:lipoprotein-anchoring transpeptidase ErfK/SrfK
MPFRTLMMTGIALFGLAAPAHARSATGATSMVEAAAALAPNQFAWAEMPAATTVTDAVAQPVSVVVSIPDQRAYVYRGERLIAVSSVSTGKDGKETPTGVYPILQKEVTHKSNLYDAAPMPYMQRLTWDGIALHAGRNPGFPDSHGCIRLPTAFAKKLFAVTELGSTVTVIDSSVATGDGGGADLLPYEVAETAQQEAARAKGEVKHANAEQLAFYQQ